MVVSCEPITTTLSDLTDTFTNYLNHPTFIYISRLFILLIPLSAFYFIYTDYQNYLALGPGGTPSTPLGYLKIKLLSIIRLRNVYKPARVPPHFRPQRGYLSSLPKRDGKRPRVAGIAPQRQQDQRSSATIYKHLTSSLKILAQDPTNKLLERTSCFEKHSSGLFSLSPITRTCRGEVCHAHPSDGSLHMTLHPADAKILLESGWGERHPLAKGGWFRRFVPKEFCLVYAPRKEEEVQVVVSIVCAAAWWVSGIYVGKGDGEWQVEKGIGEEKWISKA